MHVPKPCDRSHPAATVTSATDRMLTCIAMSEIAVYQAVIQYRANTYQLGARTKMYSASNRLLQWFKYSYL